MPMQVIPKHPSRPVTHLASPVICSLFGLLLQGLVIDYTVHHSVPYLLAKMHGLTGAHWNRFYSLH